MRRAVVAALTAGLCSAGMTACSDDPSPDPPATSSSTTSATTPTTPTTTSPTEPEPPQLPALARENSQAGAKAFIRYYIAVLNYSYKTRESSVLRRASLRNCEVCSSIAEDIDRLRANNGYQEGGEWTVLSLRLLPGSSGDLLIYIAKVSVAAGKSVEEQGGKVTQIKAHQDFFEFHVARVASAWRVSDLRPG